MLKGLILCFIVLFVQLAVLNVVDARLYNSQDARQVSTTMVTPHREKEGEDDMKQS
ncbi:hypothetical protein [Vreelandella olivaria]|uniref:hypothetical protein n=1 Tax=Vreelandella olivaria TaxID=390919 RepID=UPI00201E8759|nr:hypothetical protein [Halomonas olivaria]